MKHFFLWKYFKQILKWGIWLMSSSARLRACSTKTVSVPKTFLNFTRVEIRLTQCEIICFWAAQDHDKWAIDFHVYSGLRSRTPKKCFQFVNVIRFQIETEEDLARILIFSRLSIYLWGSQPINLSRLASLLRTAVYKFAQKFAQNKEEQNNFLPIKFFSIENEKTFCARIFARFRY